ncbi:MAG: ABC transporter permease [Gammaproteobacteria bacterium]|nr:ABC transporter permease [Gammaproteobacteria bacterium]
MQNNFFWLLGQGTLETIYMVVLSGIIAIGLGLPLGIILFTTRKGGILQNSIYNRTLSSVINVLRAIPFIILLIALIPLTRLIVGSSIGTNAAIIPLSIASIPFVARIVESALVKIGDGLIETGIAMGSSPLQTITKIMIPEALPLIIHGFTTTLIGLVGYSAMAGAVGGGGLGAVAINYGYQRFDLMIMLATIIILILLVYVIQYLGDRIANRFTH